MALRRDFYKERVKSHYFPNLQEAAKSNGSGGGMKSVQQGIIAGKEVLSHLSGMSVPHICNN